MSIDMDEIAQIFIEESVDGLDIMESSLLNLDLGAADPETMNTIFRAAHSIKGGGATFGFTQISDFAHHVETLLDEMRQGLREVTQANVDVLLLSVDCIRNMIGEIGTGDIDTTRADELQIELEKILGSAGESSSESTADAASGAPEDSVSGEEKNTTTVVETEEKLVGWDIVFKPFPGILKSCNDPQRIFKELNEFGETLITAKGIDGLNFDEMDPEECVLYWEISLDSDTGKEDIEGVFAWVLDECELTLTPKMITCETVVEVEPSNENEEPVNVEGNENSKEVAVEDEQPEKAPAAQSEKPAEKPQLKSVGKPAAKSSGNQDSGSIRVSIEKVDALVNLVGELVITQSMLGRFNGDFDFTQLPQLRDGLAQLARNSRELQESVMAIRMLPISFAFNRFPRLVRDTGNNLNKKVELRLRGEHTELDKTVLEKIGDPLVHLVRNSLDHGLESPEVRVAAGKPETGILELNAYHEGGNIIIQVVDDGAGINRDKVLEKAIERGVVKADEQLTDDQINNLIFMAGFSTADQVSDLSGRGVGMDVVRRNIADLGGHVAVKSEPGVGSTFTIQLPLTLAILDGQQIRVGDDSYIIPLISIVETIQTSSDQVNLIAGKSELFKLRGEHLPILRLSELFSVRSDSKKIDDGLLVVAESGGQRVGIFVDELLEQQQVVIKSLEANYRQMAGISGATILGDGKVALILDVPGLIRLFYEINEGRQALS